MRDSKGKQCHRGKPGKLGKKNQNLLNKSLEAQLYLQFLFITQHKAPFINTSEEQKGRETKQRMANVQMSRAVNLCTKAFKDRTCFIQRATTSYISYVAFAHLEKN